MTDKPIRSEEGSAEFSIFKDDGTIIKRQSTILPAVETESGKLASIHRGLDCKIKFKNAGQYDSTWACSGNVTLPCEPAKVKETWDWIGNFLCSNMAKHLEEVASEMADTKKRLNYK